MSDPNPYRPPSANPYAAPAYGAPPGPRAYGAAPAYNAPVYGAATYPAPAYGALPAAFLDYAAGPRLQSWPRRVVAYLVDGLAVLPFWFASDAFARSAVPRYDTWGQRVSGPTAHGVTVLLVGVVLTVGAWLWNRGYLGGMQGRSLGKRVVGATLVGVDTGEPIGFGRALARDVVHLVDGVLYIGFLRPLWEPRKQTFADSICSSVVVS